MSAIIARCAHCDSEFTEDMLKDVSGGCPSCGTKSLPMSPDHDVLVKVNWHELRVLTMWSENYARSIQGTHPDGPGTVRAIARRLQAQFPGKAPLTMAGEMGALLAEGAEVKLVDGSGKTIIGSPPKGKA